ncbi:MAG: glutathione S-transferase C-terminal domain-containing protein [Sneathiella sp.]|nr:glutathione S-transferase C-terminal domain-containing protein [Sneathiella sp.]
MISKNRYRLFISESCPWCHRVTLVHKLKGLQDLLPIHIVGEPRMQGYSLNKGHEVAVPGLPQQGTYLHELYSATETNFTGRSTIPVLWDDEAGCILNNESSEILRLLNELPATPDDEVPDLYPSAHRGEIDEWDNILYDALNNGVYRAGFAQSQSAYDDAVIQVFQTLDHLDRHFENNKFLIGDLVSMADCKLYPTLIRFDPVYYSHFKCSLRQIRDYSNITRYLGDLDQHYDFADTVNLDAIRFAYFYNDRSINPFGIVPKANAGNSK